MTRRVYYSFDRRSGRWRDRSGRFAPRERAERWAKRQGLVPTATQRPRKKKRQTSAKKSPRPTQRKIVKASSVGAKKKTLKKKAVKKATSTPSKRRSVIRPKSRRKPKPKAVPVPVRVRKRFLVSYSPTVPGQVTVENVNRLTPLELASVIWRMIQDGYRRWRFWYDMSGSVFSLHYPQGYGSTIPIDTSVIAGSNKTPDFGTLLSYVQGRFGAPWNVDGPIVQFWAMRPVALGRVTKRSRKKK